MKAAFAHYGLLDDQVVFPDGRFADTLAATPLEKLALLRLDGDIHGAAMDALPLLYDRVSPGGVIIIDDYAHVAACRQAVDDFRRARNIEAAIIDVDGCRMYWRKPPDVSAIPRLEPVSGGAPRPFWSVVVPIYERRSYVRQCLDSVLDQDPGPEEMEILVVDDASPSDLSDLINSIGRGRVSYIRNANNLGLYASTNAALRATRGRWLHVLHDDDWVMPGFYTTLKNAMETAPDAIGVAFCMYVNCYERDGSTWSPPPFRTGAGTMPRDFLARLAAGNPLNLPAVVYRRRTFERVGLFREDLPFTADWEWYVRSALQVDWHYQPEALARYRVHAGNQTLDLARTGRTARDIRRTLDIFADVLPREMAVQTLPASRRFHARQFLSTALAQLQAGSQELAEHFLSEALAIDPDAPARLEFAQLLQHPLAASLRDFVRAALLRRSLQHRPSKQATG
jgi:glycosyltransferase involved in cell wall biosynthesis